ncbi:hypothetical protein DVK44_15895 [Streptomyces paludis]|uniref:Uncharacterized protein n=1 Tax=Streptomyces paludis TaxID=2282738 RepID=A0A345I0Z9_9ACTN|nr:hypothetical protein DVK44_15895 [Streptomyces paludis]
MGEVDLRHATTAEHRAQLVPAAEATRLFHNVRALSVSPRPHRRVVRRCAAGAYGTGHAGRGRPVTVT